MIQLNGETMAYLGDSLFELEVRTFLIKKGITKVDKLHKTAINYTSAKSQATIVDHLIDNNLLSENELAVFKRGRNSNHSANRRKISAQEYQKSTGFEALLGYLHLSNEIDRFKQLIDIAINFVGGDSNE